MTEKSITANFDTDTLPLNRFLTACDISVDILTKDHITTMYNLIHSSYLGYRQCYTRNLDIHFSDEYVSETMKQLRMYYSESIFSEVKRKLGFNPKIDEEYNKFLNNEIKQFRSKQLSYLDYVCMCRFIAEHSNHESPMEHGSITVNFKNVSRVTTHQHVRHRIASHSQKSQRLKNERTPEFMEPTTITNSNSDASKWYRWGISMMMYAAEMIRQSDPTIPAEDIRYIYPSACVTDILTTMNIRSWCHYFEERCCSKAQWEIRRCADTLLCQFKIFVPFIFANAGPKCYRLGYCPEEHSCGRSPQRER